MLVGYSSACDKMSIVELHVKCAPATSQNKEHSYFEGGSRAQGMTAKLKDSVFSRQKLKLY